MDSGNKHSICSLFIFILCILQGFEGIVETVQRTPHAQVPDTVITGAILSLAYTLHYFLSAGQQLADLLLTFLTFLLIAAWLTQTLHANQAKALRRPPLRVRPTKRLGTLPAVHLSHNARL